MNDEDKKLSFIKPNIPPIVENLIIKMFDKTTNLNVRTNHRDNIEMIRNVCNEALDKFDREVVLASKKDTNKRSKIRAAYSYE